VGRALGWRPRITSEGGLERTGEWSLANTDWLARVTSGGNKDYSARHYGQG